MPTTRAIREAMTALSAAGYPVPASWSSFEAGPRRQQLMASAVASWEIVLHDVSDLELGVAVTLWMSRSQWWPKPAELRALVDAGRPPRDPLAGYAITTGDEAWGAAMELVGRHGWYAGQPARLAAREEDHQALEAAIRSVGGWRALCETRTDDSQRRASFVRAYEAARSARLARLETGRMLEGAEVRRIEDLARSVLRTDVVQRDGEGG